MTHYAAAVQLLCMNKLYWSERNVKSNSSLVELKQMTRISGRRGYLLPMTIEMQQLRVVVIALPQFLQNKQDKERVHCTYHFFASCTVGQ